MNLIEAVTRAVFFVLGRCWRCRKPSDDSPSPGLCTKCHRERIFIGLAAR